MRMVGRGLLRRGVVEARRARCSMDAGWPSWDFSPSSSSSSSSSLEPGIRFGRAKSSENLRCGWHSWSLMNNEL